MKKTNHGKLLSREKLMLRGGVIWEIPKSERYPDGIRYRLALVDYFMAILKEETKREDKKD